MSDFLTNLVDRSLCITATVGPQLPSIFEPPSMNGGAFFHRTETPELPPIQQHHQDPLAQLPQLRIFKPDVATPESATESVAPLSSTNRGPSECAQLPNASPQTPTCGEPPRNQDSVLRSGTRRVIADGAKKGEVDPALFQPQIPTEHAPSLPSAEKSLARSPARNSTQELRTENITEITSECDAYPGLTRVRDVNSASANKHVPYGRTKDQPREPRAKKITETTIPKRDAGQEIIQMRDVHTVSQREPSPSPIGRVPRPKNISIPPAISVTIGRVEIRAVPPPSRQGPRPKPPATLSLEDYLRRRTNGDRR
jgi:hypothetical protein